MIDPNGILMIEPVLDASQEPVLDGLTRKMATALAQSTVSPHAYRGYHQCRCGAQSDNRDHFVAGLLTNLLAAHYLAWHRNDVCTMELGKVDRLEVTFDPELNLEIPWPAHQIPDVATLSALAAKVPFQNRGHAPVKRARHLAMVRLTKPPA